MADAPEWTVGFEIRSSMDGGRTVLKQGTVTVFAYDESDARLIAIESVHENVPEADPRIDPYVITTTAEQDDGWVEVVPDSIGRAVDHIHEENADGRHRCWQCRGKGVFQPTGPWEIMEICRLCNGSGQPGFCLACSDTCVLLNILTGDELRDIIEEFHSDTDL